MTLAVLAVKLDHITEQLEKLATRSEEDHQDLESVKTTIQILKWSGGVLTTIVVALAIAAIKQALGI